MNLVAGEWEAACEVAAVFGVDRVGLTRHSFQRDLARPKTCELIDDRLHLPLANGSEHVRSLKLGVVGVGISEVKHTEDHDLNCRCRRVWALRRLRHRG